MEVGIGRGRVHTRETAALLMLLGPITVMIELANVARRKRTISRGKVPKRMNRRDEAVVFGFVARIDALYSLLVSCLVG